MGEIYSAAKDVIVWLGKNSTDLEIEETFSSAKINKRITRLEPSQARETGLPQRATTKSSHLTGSDASQGPTSWNKQCKGEATFTVRGSSRSVPLQVRSTSGVVLPCSMLRN